MITDKALNTYKAIYGQEPVYTPYKGASHTPFNGMDVDLVKTLVNETEVNKYLKAWKEDNTPKVISLYSFVSDRNYVVGIFNGDLYAIQDIETGKLGYVNRAKPVIPKPGYADTLRLAVVRTKHHLYDYCENTRVEHVEGKSTGFISLPFRVDKTTKLFHNSIATGSVVWDKPHISSWGHQPPDILPIHKVNIQ